MAQSELAKKMAFIGQSLESVGFPKDRVSIGLEEGHDKGTENKVLIVIRQHTPYSPFPKNKRSKL